MSATNEKACVDKGSMNSGDRSNGVRPIQVIDGINFRHAIDGGAAAGHAIDLDKYWGLDKGKCFEIATALTYSNFASYAPGMIREFTKRDQKKVTAELNKIVASFRAFDSRL